VEDTAGFGKISKTISCHVAVKLADPIDIKDGSLLWDPPAVHQLAYK
jgi:hypothetical protein